MADRQLSLDTIGVPIDAVDMAFAISVDAVGMAFAVSVDAVGMASAVSVDAVGMASAVSVDTVGMDFAVSVDQTLFNSLLHSVYYKVCMPIDSVVVVDRDMTSVYMTVTIQIPRLRSSNLKSLNFGPAVIGVARVTSVHESFETLAVAGVALHELLVAAKCGIEFIG